jgi:hypothetical protein
MLDFFLSLFTLGNGFGAQNIAFQAQAILSLTFAKILTIS